MILLLAPDIANIMADILSWVIGMIGMGISLN
jgi:hypothetical protein